MTRHNHNRAFLKWLVSWLTTCFLISLAAGGINCQCPDPSDDEGQIIDGSAQGNNSKDCYCVAPGTPCVTEKDCRTKVLYCIELFCRSGVCVEFPEQPPEAPDQAPKKRPPACPSSCKQDSDCKPEVCGDFNICKDNYCQRNDVVIP